MSGVSTLYFNKRASADLARIQKELYQLQGKTASGREATSLQEFGQNGGRVVETRGLIALSESRAEAAGQLGARFDLQASALSNASGALNRLAGALRDAAINDDGRLLRADAELTFGSLVASLNESFGGQPLFAGERIGDPPVIVGSLSELGAVTGPDQVFDEAARRQRIDLGDGVSFELGEKASEIGWPALQTLRDLQQLFDSAGGDLPERMSDVQKANLVALADRLEDSALTFIAAEGRTGLLAKRLEDEKVRLESRSVLLQQTMSDLSEADLAEVAAQFSALQTQYQASAQTFITLTKLSLLEFLR
jgi:flagellin-like hook-associated protein FlgL